MKNILVISGHPELSKSTANRVILNELSRHPLISLKDIKENYPDGLIDVNQEQADLHRAELIVLQFPFIWYGMPSHLKGWMEKVFAMGFAFGKDGDKLKKKKVMLSITLGGSAQAYSADGQHQHSIEIFLKPLKQFIHYCGMEYLSPVISYAMSPGPDNNEEMVKSKAEKHARKILSEIEKITLKEFLDQGKQ